MSKSRTYTTWDINDLAFLTYADYRSLSHKDIAKIFGVSTPSVSQQMNKMRHPENYSPRVQDKINKAEILEMKIRGGSYPDHREAWDSRLTKVTGIKYSCTKPPEELEEKKPEKETSSEELQHPPLLTLSISTEAVLSIIKAWKGAIS